MNRPGPLQPRALLATTFRPARALILQGRHFLRNGAGTHEGEFDHPDGAAPVATRLGIGERPVADDAGAHGVASGAPLRPPRDAHARCESGRPYLSPGSPRTEGELGDYEPAQHVRSPTSAEARIGERDEEHTADRRKALVGEDLDLSGVAEVGHAALASSMEPTNVLEHGRRLA